MKSAVLGATLAAFLFGTAQAADDTTWGAWDVLLGAGYSGYDVNDKEDDDPDGWNNGVFLDSAVIYHSTHGFDVQLDAEATFFSPPDNDNDWTNDYMLGAVHLLYRTDFGFVGAFVGGGSSDADDSDESQTFWFGGGEFRYAHTENTFLFGQAGFMFSNDEYDEGLDDVGFVRLGARTFVIPDWSLMGAVSAAWGGTEDNSYDATVVNLELEAEYAIGHGSTSVFAAYNGTFMLPDNNHDDLYVQGVMLGLRWRPGMRDLKTLYAEGPTASLPSVDRWFAFSANEYEN